MSLQGTIIPGRLRSELCPWGVNIPGRSNICSKEPVDRFNLQRAVPCLLKEYAPCKTVIFAFGVFYFKMMTRFIVYGQFAYIQPCLNQLDDVHKCFQYHEDCKTSHLDRFWLFNNCSLYYFLWWTVWFPCKEVYRSSNYPSKSLTDYRWVFSYHRVYNKFIDINQEQPFR